MNCVVSSIVGTAMLGAMFSTLSVTEEQHEVLKKTLSKELAIKYENIANERRNQFIQGIVIGLVISYFLLKLIKTTNFFHRISFVTAISLTFSVIYYFLMPKSDYMLNHLKTEEQNKAWLEVYKTMKQRYFLGFTFGILAGASFAMAMC